MWSFMQLCHASVRNRHKEVKKNVNWETRCHERRMNAFMPLTYFDIPIAALVLKLSLL